MKALIIGGAGYIGTKLIHYMQSSGHEVTVFDSLLHGGDALLPFFSDVNFHFIKGDVRDGRQVCDAIKGQDIIVHLAALVGVPACENEKEAYDVNVGGTVNVLQSMNKYQQLVYASTVSVYGKSDTGQCSETTKPAPQSTYGKTKLEAEILCANSGAAVLRLATVFGIAPRMRLDLVINRMTYDAVKNKQITVFESNFVRPWVHVRDVARAITYATDRHLYGKIYNVVAQNMTKLEVADIIREETKACITLSKGHDVDARNYKVSAERLRGLGFIPAMGVRRGITEMVGAFHAIEEQRHHRNA